jgi:hypothetical protein
MRIVFLVNNNKKQCVIIFLMSWAEVGSGIGSQRVEMDVTGFVVAPLFGAAAAAL